MSSRYPPTRDRSPPRQFDRRPSSTYSPTPSSAYRPGNESTANSAPPRGPRAESFRGGFTFSTPSRGRGGFPRGGDSWDRDRDRDRDGRPAASTFRRDDDRQEWRGRDRDFASGDRSATFNRERSHVGRDRSASPSRPRRDSKENLPSAGSRTSDSASTYFGPGAHGAATRGRGRGDWERSRGGSSFAGERDRDLFAARSRSREGWRDRDYDRARTFGPDADRGDRFDRRDYDRATDRESRPREHDVWQRDHSPGRSSAGNRAASPSAMSTVSQDRTYKSDYDANRKPPLLQTSMSVGRDGRRDADTDYFSSRPDSGRRDGAASQPFSAPQSASAGLDYGPPPSAPVTTPLATDKPSKTTAQPPAVKAETASVSAGFQPPSGPKAERAFPASTSVQSAEQRLKTETVSRQTEAALEPKPTPASTVGDRQLPPNIPSGPRAAAIASYKPRPTPTDQSLQNVPAAAPTQPKANAMENRGPPMVPTGPRGNAFVPPAGPRGGPPTGPAGSPPMPGSASWRRPQPEFAPRKPSIMNQLNKPPQSDRLPQRSSGQVASPQAQFAKLNTGKHTGTDHAPDHAVKSLSPSMSKITLLERVQDREPASPTDVEMSMPASEDEDEIEDDDGLDEDYFAMSEETHARDMELLRARKPPPLLQDPAIVNLLIRIQMLNMIIDGAVPAGIEKTLGPIPAPMDVDSMPGLGPPSPDKTPEDGSTSEYEHPQPRGRPLKELPINPIPTPPIEDLPYLTKGALGLTVFEDAEVDDVENEAVNMLLRQEFEHDVWDQRGDIEDLQTFYRGKYPEWRYDIERLERIRRETYEPTPDPGSPGAQSVASLPVPTERLTGRAARNATDFDIEKAILMSQQSAKEEEERREREAAANAGPNYDVEAVVPFMLTPCEREPYWSFADTSQFVPSDLVVEVMRLAAPEDDFTDEEQTQFITAFCQTPKKWGTIADSISGRSYQECIAHYYLTKNDAHYKEIWRRSQPKRRRGRAATKPRSTALISDMALNEDKESTPIPMTDSGRPRRAAAPTFGDIAVESDASTTLSTAKRLAAGIKDGSDTAPTRGVKGRKPGAGGKTRRTKAQILADAQALGLPANGEESPQKAPSGRSRTILRADNTISKADMLAGAGVGVEGGLAPLAQSGHGSQPVATPTPVVTSYWSVPEQQKFRQLIAYYGRDYARIAEFMKTKSQAMIKNQFTREIGKGDQALEKAALLAEEKRERGDPMGAPPSPIAPPKRKYEATPPMTASSRMQTAATEILATESGRAVAAAKPKLVEDFPANTLHRDANGGIVAKPQARDVMQHSPLSIPVHPRTEDGSRDPRHGAAPRSMQGPPRGHFVEDVGVYQPGHARQQGLSADQVLHHHPPQLVDLRAGETHPHQAGVVNRNNQPQSKDQYHTGQQMVAHPTHPSAMPDRPATSSSRHGHSRNGSLSGHPPSTMEQQAADLMALRHAEQPRRIHYGVQHGQSPSLAPVQSSLPPRVEPLPASTSMPKAEPSKPAPVKRSNVFSILNDEPPEPPAKRSSIDSLQRASINTPPPQGPTSHYSMMQQPQQRLHEDPHSRSSQTSYGHKSNQSMGQGQPDYRSGYPGSPAPGHQRDPWLDKFDPRQQAANDRQSHHSPAMSHYSLVPPSSQQNRMDGPRTMDGSSHRRSLLGIGHASSPPPPQQSSNPSYRSTSDSSQHGRVSSIGYPHTHDQQSLQPQPSGGHSQSASSTPVSAMHQRGQGSIDYGPRLTIQQHMAQQRELDMISQRDPPPRQLQAPTQDQYRQDHSSHHGGPTVPPPPSQTPQPGHVGLGYASQPPRTYTPPHGGYGSDPRGDMRMHSHQHHHSMSQHQGQSGTSSAPQHQIPPPPPSHQGMGLGHQHPHQGQTSLNHGHGMQSQHQQQQQQQQQHQRPPPPPLGLAPPPGHYRGYSQGGDERR